MIRTVTGSREETIRSVYDCFNDGRTGALDELIPPMAVLVQDPSFPDARTWQGAAGVKRWYSQLTAQFSDVGVELKELLTDGEAALAVVEITVQGRTSGAAVRHGMAHVWTFRGDALERCRFYLDVEAGRAAFNELRAGAADSAL